VKHEDNDWGEYYLQALFKAGLGEILFNKMYVQCVWGGLIFRSLSYMDKSQQYPVVVNSSFCNMHMLECTDLPGRVKGFIIIQ